MEEIFTSRYLKSVLKVAAIILVLLVLVRLA
jgi:hypothetical protein